MLDLNEFERDSVEIYLDEKYRDEIFSKIKFFNQKTDKDIHPLLTEIKMTFIKWHPRENLEWELRRTHENLKSDYKIYRVGHFNLPT